MMDTREGEARRRRECGAFACCRCVERDWSSPMLLGDGPFRATQSIGRLEVGAGESRRGACTGRVAGLPLLGRVEAGPQTRGTKQRAVHTTSYTQAKKLHVRLYCTRTKIGLTPAAHARIHACMHKRPPDPSMLHFADIKLLLAPGCHVSPRWTILCILGAGFLFKITQPTR
eukprot:366197-Chlamydomonas_euryale.AAC.13